MLLDLINGGGWLGASAEKSRLKHDLDETATRLILFDLISRTSSEKAAFDMSAATSLCTNLIRFLGSNLPSIALRTAYTDKFGDTEFTLQSSLDQVSAGTELLLLDLRQRPSATEQSEHMSKAEYLESAWKSFEESCDELLAQEMCESFDICSLAFAHHLLFGSVDNRQPEKKRPIPLHEAKIRMSLRRKHWAWRQMRRLLTLLSDLLVGCASDRQGPPKAQHVSETNQTTNPGRMGCHFCPKAMCPH